MKHILITALVFALGFVATSAQADDMLYNDLGGEKGIATIVDNATAAFLADPRIKDTFSETNMDRFKLKLAEQLCVVSGGPASTPVSRWPPRIRRLG